MPTYDISDFSEKTKNFRKILGFTISDVATSTGLNQSTIKLIESGKVIPRFDTLKILSSFYKHDLFGDLKESLYGSMTIFMFNSLSTYSATNNVAEQEKALILISNHLDNTELNSIEYKDLKQLKLFVEGLIIASKSNFENSLEIEEALTKYCEALSVTVPTFTFENYSAYKYFSVEFNILFSAAVMLGIKRECVLSNDILFFTLNYFQVTERASKINCLLVSKLYYNLAYNFHRMDKHDSALEYSIEGIKYCIQNDTHQYLPLLLGRKGVAMYNLRHDEWRIELYNAITMLKIQGSDDLIPAFENLVKRLDMSDLGC